MPGLMVAGFDEDNLRKVFPVMLYLDNGKKPLEWLDDDEASRLSAAFREGRADGVMEVFRTGRGRLGAFSENLASRPVERSNPRDWVLFAACFYNTSVFLVMRDSGFLARTTAAAGEAGMLSTDLLDRAITAENPEIVRFLLDAGHDPNRRFEDGATPLYRACQWKANPATVELLLERGALVDGWTSAGCTALAAAIDWGDERAADLLFERGASATVKSGGDEFLLHRAAFRGNAVIVEKLLRRGADPNATDHTGKTPLHRAAENGDAATVKLLLAAGANVDARNRDGLFPLRVAVKQGKADAVAVLLAHGAADPLDPETRDRLLGMAKHMQRHYREHFGDERGVPPMETARKRKDIVAMLEERFQS